MADWRKLLIGKFSIEPKFSYWIDEAGHSDISVVGDKNYFATIKTFSGKLEK
jgi:hypothetical protein